jgi:aarF domain-containing kinase
MLYGTTGSMPISMALNYRIVQANNQMLGAPVNRVKIIGLAAADAIPRSPGLSLGGRVKERFHEGIFYTVMASIDAAFWLNRTWRWMTGSGEENFEDELDRQMREMAKTQYGIDIDQTVYDA